MKLNIVQNPAGQRGGAGTKQAEGLTNLKLLPQKALFHPTNSKIFKVRRGWEYPPSVPRAVDFSHWTVQTWTKRMCKYTHTTLASKYSQTLMTSRFSLIVVFLNPWFSCGGGLRTIGDLGGWRGAKDNCGLGIFASWTMRSIFGSQFSFFFFFPSLFSLQILCSGSLGSANARSHQLQTWTVLVCHSLKLRGLMQQGVAIWSIRKPAFSQTALTS